MLSDTDVEDHYSPTVRLVSLEKTGTSCGFQLTRGKWDPYPWVNSVGAGTAAEAAGIRSGDCLLEVNSEDVLGRRISEVAEIVKSKPEQVSLLLWNAGVDSQCSPEAICCGPMPTNLQRLSACMSTILAFLECPVCLDTIPPPTYQCENGHLICMRCRTKSERCPVCRLRFTRGRSLLSDQVYNALIDAFNLREEPENARAVKMQRIFKMKKNSKVPEIKITPSHTHKFLARIVGKATSVDNLTNKLDGCDHGLQLRAKSLSTHELFDTGSPAVSRANSISRLSRNEKKRNFLDPEYRSSSCHGSFESLQKNEEEELVFFCPFTDSCSCLIKGKQIIEHFQRIHDGPLTQYFKSRVKINFSKVAEHKDLCYLMQIDTNVFFFKIELDNKNDQNGNVLLWTWLMDGAKAAKEFEMQVEVLTGTGNVILSVRNGIFSLNTTSYSDIKKLKKGVLLNTINFSTNNIVFDINICKSEYL